MPEEVREAELSHRATNDDHEEGALQSDAETAKETMINET